jgi:hypothetical protein
MDWNETTITEVGLALLGAVSLWAALVVPMCF